MSGSLPFPSARYARSSRLVAYLSLAYLLLVVYASLYPFADWRVPNDEAARFLFTGWPSYIVASDVVLNVLAYVPLGLLLTGKHIEATGITVFHIVGGKIVEEWNEYDMLGLLRQLGLLPPRQPK